MKIQRETRKWGRVLKMIGGLLFISVFSGLIYYMFEPTLKENAIYPAIMTALFLLLCGVTIVAFWGKEFTALALDKAFYKNAFFSVLFDASGRATLDFGPPTRSFKFPSNDEKIPDLTLTLGPTSTFIGNSPMFLGTDASIFNVDIVNVIHRKLTDYYKVSTNFADELLKALENSKTANPHKYFKMDAEGRVLRDPFGKPMWRDENTKEIKELKELMCLDLNKLFPLTSMSIDFQGMLLAMFNGGIRVGQIRSFEELLKNRKVQVVGGLLILLCGAAGAFAYQTYEIVSTSIEPKMDQLNRTSVANNTELKALQETILKEGSNLDLLPSLTPTPAEGG